MQAPRCGPSKHGGTEREPRADAREVGRVPRDPPNRRWFWTAGRAQVPLAAQPCQIATWLRPASLA